MNSSESSVSSTFESHHLENDNFWEVKANNTSYNAGIKERTSFLFKKRKYADNKIRTSKYTILTFLPLNLFEQFQRVANFYFLLICILQTIPAIATLPWFTTMIPLTMVLAVTAVKDIIDDVARHRNDSVINNRQCEVLKGKGFTFVTWKELEVGDVVCLKKDDFVPADLFLLSSSEPNSLCYVETAEIDGETNLKFRQALSVTHDKVNTLNELAKFDGRIICESPNCDLHSFIGTLYWQNQEYSIDNEKILLRGCRIRNAEKCYGVVIFAGVDTKIMRNSGRYTLKKTTIELIMNRVVSLVLLILVVTSIGLAIGAVIWDVKLGVNMHYLGTKSKINLGYEGFLAFWSYIILMNSILPMSLYVTFELLHVAQSFFIKWDLEMYCEESDTPANARTTTLNEELGQIKFIFSDKTGTLTQNILAFKKCCIDGQIYGNQYDDSVAATVADLSWNTYADGRLKFYDSSLVELIQSGDHPGVHNFFKLLALCHTVMVEEKDGQLIYQAASPDEGALASAARNYGYAFLSRTQDSITISELGVQKTYTVLAILDFTSGRKRMSVILKDSEGKIKLYSKGADTVIYERLQLSCPHRESTQIALDQFATETLRTLCLASKDVEENDFQDWSQRHQKATVALQNREHLLEALYEEIETNLVLVGATAIEDKLQIRVPETIQNLKKADIKIWVLTGDKKETAINVGYSCRLLSDQMEIFEGHDLNVILERLQKNDHRCRDDNAADISDTLRTTEESEFLSCNNKALILTGSFLDKFTRSSKQPLKKDRWWQKQLAVVNLVASKSECNEVEARERAFVELACQCQAVICCRVTPNQKALVVQMVKKYQRVITLAIGDGANDVNMLKTAHIGVGISGQEGMQAVLASDYSLAQFYYLERLLLVHGRWAYQRICKFLRYFLYKTFTFSFVHIWFAFFSGFSGQSVYELWCVTLYKVAYSWLPVLSIGVLDKDLSDVMSIKYPKRYKVGQRNKLFNYKIFLATILHGLLSSFVIFFIPYGAFLEGVGHGGTTLSGYQFLAMAVGTGAVLTINIEIMLDISSWTVPSVVAIMIDFFLYFCMTFLTQSNFLSRRNPYMFQFNGAALNAFKQPLFWLTVLLVVAINIIPSLTFRFILRCFSSKDAGIVIYEDLLDKGGRMMDDKASHFKRESVYRRSSYAFSQNKGFANLITSGVSLRKKKTSLQSTNSEKTEPNINVEANNEQF